MKATDARNLATTVTTAISSRVLENIYNSIKEVAGRGALTLQADMSKYETNVIADIIKSLEDNGYKVQRCVDSDIDGDSWDYLVVKW